MFRCVVLTRTHIPLISYIQCVRQLQAYGLTCTTTYCIVIRCGRESFVEGVCDLSVRFVYLICNLAQITSYELLLLPTHTCNSTTSRHYTQECIIPRSTNQIAQKVMQVTSKFYQLFSSHLRYKFVYTVVVAMVISIPPNIYIHPVIGHYGP